MELHETAREQARLHDLLRLMPTDCETVLDVGARDGYISRNLLRRFQRVTALDLVKPKLPEHPRLAAVEGDVTSLQYPAQSFDVVLCAEVLEHIPPHLLPTACRELSRVASHTLLIGVPYRQDVRLGRTLCPSCRRRNPPWGHVNTFDERSIRAHFPEMEAAEISFVGETREQTTALAAWLMDRSGNLYGTYQQQEGCIHCGARLAPPPPGGISQRICAKASLSLDAASRAIRRPRPRWMHVRFVRPSVAASLSPGPRIRIRQPA